MALQTHPQELVPIRFAIATNLYKHSEKTPEQLNEAIEHLEIGLRSQGDVSPKDLEQFYFLLADIYMSQNRILDASRVLKSLCDTDYGKTLGKAHAEYGKTLMKTKIPKTSEKLGSLSKVPLHYKKSHQISNFSVPAVHIN
eukprot:TRINITY_DN10082_c0_g1_i1.p1 TRINITY_DN10082_c0_g1~~TRINITY_DN10082_c0_g1_i1.p1  ORF type:complete len:141 (+),score=24.19 TRINITY_DN10082_c0_g1_i1:339-761(+)